MKTYLDNEVSCAGLLSLEDEAQLSWLETETPFPAPNKREPLVAFCPRQRTEPGGRFRGFQRRVSPHLTTCARGRSFSNQLSDQIKPWRKFWSCCFGSNQNNWPCHALSWQWSLEFMGPKGQLISELYLPCIWRNSSLLKKSCIQRDQRLAPSVEGQGFIYKIAPM